MTAWSGSARAGTSRHPPGGAIRVHMLVPCDPAPMSPTVPPSDPDRSSKSEAHGDVHTFLAKLWSWDARRHDTWTFVTLPPDVSAAVEDEADSRGPRAGFGSVKVQVRIGATTWLTSVFPDTASGCFVLPIKRAVRQANGVEAGDDVEVHLRLAKGEPA